jgi:signal transduction histidine kinase
MRSHLGVKLFVSYLVVLLVGILVLVLVAQVSLPGAYGRHFGQMIDTMNGNGMVDGGTGMGHGFTTGDGQELYANFRVSFFEALAWATLVALSVAGVVSMFIGRQLIAPLKALTTASQRISEGRYNERVSEGGKDELGQLATSFNAMAEKLQDVETIRRRLIGDVAHELRTPLTVIKGSMEGLIDGVLPATSQTFVQISKEAERLNRLVDDLQELSRVESGAVSLNISPGSIHELVRVAYKRLSGSYHKKGIGITIDLPSKCPDVMADTDRIIQVLTNLLGNALEYTPAGGNVTVAAELTDTELIVHIIDNGIGIAPEHLAHIFDRFYRVDGSRSRQNGGGSGIGLTISKALIEAHGGRLWAESQGQGQGSTFSFSLPLT